MPDHPDVYADGFSLTAGPFGVTLTLTVSQPSGEPGPHEDVTEPVARVRFGRELARVLADSLGQMLAAAAQQQAGSTVKH